MTEFNKVMRRVDFLKRLGVALAGLVAAPATAVAALGETRETGWRLQPMHTPLTEAVDEVMYPILGRHIDVARLWPIAQTGDATLWHLNVLVDGELHKKRILIGGSEKRELAYQIAKRAEELARELA